MVVNIAAYHFTVIDDPPQLVERLRARAEALQLRGSALVAEEGINLFLAGQEQAIETLLGELRAQPRFAGLAVKYSHSRAQPFARLKVKLKREIIAFRRERSSPLDGRAPSVTPDTLAHWLDQGHDDAGKRVVLLDTRNREEVGYGSFDSALTLPIDNFTELPEALAPHREGLREATVVSFCTGGIRCEKAALWLRADGMDNLFQLDGGILAWFERIGARHYDGGCFVFDERVALDPQLRPLRDAAA